LKPSHVGVCYEVPLAITVVFRSVDRNMCIILPPSPLWLLSSFHPLALIVGDTARSAWGGRTGPKRRGDQSFSAESNTSDNTLSKAESSIPRFPASYVSAALMEWDPTECKKIDLGLIASSRLENSRIQKSESKIPGLASISRVERRATRLRGFFRYRMISPCSFQYCVHTVRTSNP
jgi:hypothetical protein